MTYRIAALIALLCLVQPGVGQLGEGKSGDSRVRAALDELNLKYSVSEYGNFRLTFRLDNGRTQLLIINSNTQTLGQLEIREVWSRGYKSSSAFTASVANRLLLDSEQKKIGGWTATKLDDGSYLATYVAKIDADADARSLHTVIAAVYATADEMEEQLTGTEDEF